MPPRAANPRQSPFHHPPFRQDFEGAVAPKHSDLLRRQFLSLGQPDASNSRIAVLDDVYGSAKRLLNPFNPLAFVTAINKQVRQAHERPNEGEQEEPATLAVTDIASLYFDFKE